ncbi:hypothetical protein [Fodinicola acaciae]|uniref:hypothetical protein n=1 Tax=Fodinicola acaciae TaxID=2681555 RepID=UPI0013D215E6|nr:hypothetical protein [Fodinicola acaciae]
MNGDPSKENHLRGLAEVRRQVDQFRADAAGMLEAAKCTRDQRRVDFLAGKVSSLQAVMDVIDIEVDNIADDEPVRVPGIGRIRPAPSSLFPFKSSEMGVGS